MIGLSGAGVRFGKRWIFRDLDFHLEQGCCLALLGPNGRGKTTLIRAVLGTLKLDEGTRSAPDLIGYVPQAGGAAVSYRVLDMVVMGRARSLGIFGTPSREDYEVARAALDRVGLIAFQDAGYAELSGGERQLVLLARALASEATAIVLDEPASALDLSNQNIFLSILGELVAERRFAILFSTHLPQHALHVAREAMLLLDDGEVVRGPVATAMTESNLSRLYSVAVRRVEVPVGAQSFETVVPMFGQASGPHEAAARRLDISQPSKRSRTP